MPRFLPYIEHLRGLAMMIVVAVHARGFTWEWKSHPETNRILNVFFDADEGYGTILFLFIGGFLFQYLTSDKFHYRSYLHQKFKNVIVPYLLISVPIILLRLNYAYENLALPENFEQRSLPGKITYFLLTGAHLPPFWFISTVVLIYITSPLLRLADNERFYKFAFPIVLLLGCFTFRSEHNANPLLGFVHFIPVYMLGMMASFYRDVLTRLRWRLLGPVVVAYSVLTIADLLGANDTPKNLNFEQVVSQRLAVFNVYYFKGLVFCILLMMLFYEWNETRMTLLATIGKLSFGVFFLHYPIISIFRKVIHMAGFQLDFNLATYLLFFAIVLAASLTSVLLIKRVFGERSKILIGS